MALLYEYTPAAARQNVGRGSGWLVRKGDRWNHFGHEPGPEPNMTKGNVLRRGEFQPSYHESALWRKAGGFALPVAGDTPANLSADKRVFMPGATVQGSGKKGGK